MKEGAEPETWWQRVLWSLVNSAPAAWLLRRTAHRADRLLLKLSGGRTTLTTLLTGLPVVILHTSGARSGKARSVPLLGIPWNEEVILIASNFGHPRHPAWYHNLQANGQATLTVEGKRKAYEAREAQGAERQEAWKRAVALYPGYDAYRRRAAEREIPVIILSPDRGS